MARKIKQVTFNTSKEKELLELADSIENFSWWVKSKLQYELTRNKTGIDPAILQAVGRLIDAKLASRVVMPDTKSKAGNNDDIDQHQFF